MLEEKWRRQAHYATVLGAIVTAGSMVFGVLTYQRSAVHQRQAGALGMLQEYLKLAVEHPDLASRAVDQPVDAQYDMFATHALFTAETIWTLVGDDPRSRSSIAYILRQHHGYLQQGVLNCKDYTPQFIAYVKQEVQGVKCAP